MNEVSPPELVADFLNRWGTPGLAPGGIVVGPASDAQQQAGVASIMGAGLPLIEKYIPLQWVRAQIRCLSGTLADSDAIAQALQRDIHATIRKPLYMASTDKWYLMHLCNITAGPSQHFDSAETWESLLFAEILLSSDPL